MTTMSDAVDWNQQLAAVSKQVRRDLIYRAFTEGGMTYRQISDALGDITRPRVIQIVKEERDARTAPE